MEGQLVAPEAHAGDGFGYALSASNDCSPGILAVGAPTAGVPAREIELEEDPLFNPKMGDHWSSSVPPVGAGGPGAVMVYRCNLPTDASEMGKETPTLTSYLKPPPRPADDSMMEIEAGRFGHCVSVSGRGNWLAVGSPMVTRNGRKKSGAVFIYCNTGEGIFQLEQEIVSDYSLDNDRFGWSCSVDELRGVANYSAVLVCGCLASTNRDTGRGGGFIQIYQKYEEDNSWHLIHTNDPEGNGALFGFSVSVSGDSIAVGDPADNFEFKRNQGTLWGWVRDANAAPAPAEVAEKNLNEKAKQPDEVTCEECGVAHRPRYKCAGCPNYRLESPNQGSGYFLCLDCVDSSTKKQRNTKKKSHHTHLPSHTFWDLDAELSASAMSAAHRKEDKTWRNIHGKVGGGLWDRGEPFLKNAHSVAQSDRFQASGAPGWNDGLGLVLVRELTPVKNRARGVVQAPDTLTLNPMKTQGYRFGASLDLKWPLLAVGSPGHSDKAGAAYLFLYQAGVWTQLGATMRQKSGQASMFGQAVALCGAILFVGAPHAIDAPGVVQYVHVDEDGDPALKEQDVGILWQCVRGRAGVSLPETVFHRAARKVMRDRGAPWPLARMMMIGEGRAGKTALRNALLGKPFAETDSTIGIETLTVGRLAITGTGQGQWVEGMEVDVDGVEVEMRDRAVAKHCVLEMHESSQVAAPVQRKAMADLMRLKLATAKQDSADDSAAPRMDARVPMSTLEADEAGPEMSMKRVEEYMRSCDEEREELAMEMWDFGGQPVFYILYHLFLTEFGTYLLTFSMERLAPSAQPREREACLDMIRYWLDTIALHTGTGREEYNAPLVLAGTHKDRISNVRDHEAISQLLWSTFSQHVQWPFVVPLKEGVVSTGRGLLWFYPVDNTRTSGVGRDPVLGQLITSLEGKVQAKDHVQRLVPFSWMSLYDKLQTELLAGKLVVGMDMVQDVAHECGVSEEDLELVLRYLDCMGLLLYCGDSRMHAPAVVLDTVRFLVRAATLVLCQHDIHLESLHQEAAQTQGALWQDLINNGILDVALLPLLWKGFEPSTHPILLSLMHRFGLICPIAAASAGQAPSRFVVPCLLPDDPISESPASAHTCFFAFSSGPITDLSDSDTLTFDALRNFFLPEGLFARVVAKCVEWIQHTSRDKTPLRSMSLKRREAFLSFGPHRCILQHVPEIQSLRVHILVQNTEVITDRLEVIVASVIEESYPKLTATLLLPCDSADHTKGTSKLLPLHVLRRAVEEKRGLWLGNTLASATELAAKFVEFLAQMGFLDEYDVFVSYRWTPKRGAVCDDSNLAVKLYDKMSAWALGSEGRRPAIFLDRRRLQHGRRFDDDCMQAVAASKLMVAIVSVDALQRMLTLSAERSHTEIDSVLLEWLLVLELQGLGVVSRVLPILLGRVESGRPTDFYASGIREKLPQSVAAPEIAAVQRFLDSKGWQASPMLKTMTVRGIIDAILRNLAINLWDLPQEGAEAEAKEVDQVEEEDGDFVLLDLSSSHLYEVAASRIMQYVEQSQDLSVQFVRPPVLAPAVITSAKDTAGMESGKGVDAPAHGHLGANSASALGGGAEVPVWLISVMQEDEVATFGEGMRRGLFDEGDLEFFSDEALKEAGVGRAITRARMLRRIRDRFKSASSSATGVTVTVEKL